MHFTQKVFWFQDNASYMYLYKVSLVHDTIKANNHSTCNDNHNKRTIKSNTYIYNSYIGYSYIIVACIIKPIHYQYSQKSPPLIAHMYIYGNTLSTCTCHNQHMCVHNSPYAHVTNVFNVNT